MVRSNRQGTVAKQKKKVDAGFDRNVSEYTVHHNLLHMGLHSYRPVRVPMLVSSTAKSTNSGQVSVNIGPWRNGKLCLV